MLPHTPLMHTLISPSFCSTPFTRLKDPSSQDSGTEAIGQSVMHHKSARVCMCLTLYGILALHVVSTLTKASYPYIDATSWQTLFLDNCAISQHVLCWCLTAGDGIDKTVLQTLSKFPWRNHCCPCITSIESKKTLINSLKFDDLQDDCVYPNCLQATKATLSSMWQNGVQWLP